MSQTIKGSARLATAAEPDRQYLDDSESHQIDPNAGAEQAQFERQLALLREHNKAVYSHKTPWTYRPSRPLARRRP